jgi:hypothetical protein
MKLRYLYLIFAVLGLILPYSQFIPWIAEHHALNVSIFLSDLFANRISAFFAMDVVVSAVVLISFIQTEGKRLQMRLLWLLRSVHCSSAFRLACRCFSICGNCR